MVNMLQNAAILSMLGALALNVPQALPPHTASQPQSLSAYVEAANNGTLQPDPIVNTVSNLCPVISEAAKGEGAVGRQIGVACSLLKPDNSDIPPELLAMIDG